MGGGVCGIRLGKKCKPYGTGALMLLTVPFWGFLRLLVWCLSKHWVATGDLAGG